MISPRASCLEGSKAAIECGSILEIRRKVKNAKEYKAVNCIGNYSFCVSKRISFSRSVDIMAVDFGCRGLSSFKAFEKRGICSCLNGVVSRLWIINCALIPAM